MASFQFNANAVEGDNRDFSPIPNGKYNAVIVKTELGQPNGKGTEQLKIEWDIVDGPHARRKVTNWITVACPSSKEAQDIGMRTLKNICEAVGLAGFTDSDELLGRQHVIDVGQRPDVNDKTKVFNEVKRCYPAGTPATAQAPKTATTPAQAPVNATAPAATGVTKTPPWKK
jgi:hypothetical protein